MGNDLSQLKLGIQAVAYTTPNIEIQSLMGLGNLLHQKSLESGNQDKIYKQDFEEIIRSCQNFDSSDCELLTSIFTMFDTSGEGFISYKDYLSGVGGCITTGTPEERLTAAFLLQNVSNPELSDKKTRTEIKRILQSINSIASYFGDPVVTAENIDEIVVELFKLCANPTTPLSFSEVSQKILTHPYCEIFVSGRGTVRFAR